MKRFNVINLPVVQNILSPESLAVQLASKLNWWYSADHLTVIGGLVSGATDLTGNGRDGIQNTVGNRLTYFASDPMFGNRPSFGSTTNTGARSLDVPVSLTYRHQIFSAYYGDGVQTTGQNGNFSSQATTSGQRIRVGGASGNLITFQTYTGFISKGGGANTQTFLPLPATTIRADGSATFLLQIGGGNSNLNSVVIGGFRHFVGANTVLTTEEIQLIEGVIAWDDGTQSTLISGHPYRNSPPTP